MTTLIERNPRIYLFRILVDGEGSLAVFNGHIPFEDKLYTRYNNFISGEFYMSKRFAWPLMMHST